MTAASDSEAVVSSIAGEIVNRKSSVSHSKVLIRGRKQARQYSNTFFTVVQSLMAQVTEEDLGMIRTGSEDEAPRTKMDWGHMCTNQVGCQREWIQ